MFFQKKTSEQEFRSTWNKKNRNSKTLCINSNKKSRKSGIKKYITRVKYVLSIVKPDEAANNNKKMRKNSNSVKKIFLKNFIFMEFSFSGSFCNIYHEFENCILNFQFF